MVVYLEMADGSESYTSPKVKKSLLPFDSACARIAGLNRSQKPILTCLTVSTRNPSTPKSTQEL